LRTRRLFSNINRNAQQTGAAENIALDEDDAFAILTRRLLEDHEFLSEDGRVRVILKVGDEGELKLATGSVPKGDSKALTTFTVLYDLLQYLCFDDQPSALKVKTVRPSDEVLESSFQALSGRLDDLMKSCGAIRQRLEDAASARDVRAPKGAEGEGHPFMRPVVQKSVVRISSQIIQQKLLTWEQINERLSQLDWRMAASPFEAVFNVERGSMRTGKEYTNLLDDLLHAHLAPTSVQAIKRARRKYKEITNKTYSVEEDALAALIPAGEPAPATTPIVLPTEISADPDAPAPTGTTGDEQAATTEE
jgi:DNA sulfur modification protein DndB